MKSRHNLPQKHARIARAQPLATSASGKVAGAEVVRSRTCSKVEPIHVRRRHAEAMKGI
jgi:hypothetical protein